MTNYYKQKVEVECVDNGKIVDADVLDFISGKYLSVAINTIKLNMQYDSLIDQYVGHMGGLEFLCYGLKQLGVSR